MKTKAPIVRIIRNLPNRIMSTEKQQNHKRISRISIQRNLRQQIILIKEEKLQYDRLPQERKIGLKQIHGVTKVGAIQIVERIQMKIKTGDRTPVLMKAIKDILQPGNIAGAIIIGRGMIVRRT